MTKGRRRRPLRNPPPVSSSGPKDPEYIVNVDYVYHFDEISRMGKLYLLKDDQRVYLEDVFVVDIKLTSQHKVGEVFHDNLLKCLHVNKVDGHLIFEKPKAKLSEENIFRNKKVIVYHEVPCRLPYVTQKVVTQGLHPYARRMFRQLYILIEYLHQKELSLEEFNLENIWISKEIWDEDDTLKLAGIGMRKSTTDSKKRDWTCVVNLIKAAVGKLPKILDDLTTRTSTVEVRWGVHEKNLLNHLALIPPMQTIQFIRKCGQDLNPMTTLNQQILERVASCYGWHECFIGKPEYQNLIDCYSYKSRDSSYVTSGMNNSAKVKFSMFKFARNLVEHLRFGKTDFHMESIILHLFHKQFVTAQTSLNLEKGGFSGFMKE